MEAKRFGCLDVEDGEEQGIHYTQWMGIFEVHLDDGSIVIIFSSY